MNRTLLKRVSIQFLAWAGVAVLCAVMALAQDTGAPVGHRKVSRRRRRRDRAPMDRSRWTWCMRWMLRRRSRMI